MAIVKLTPGGKIGAKLKLFANIRTGSGGGMYGGGMSGCSRGGGGDPMVHYYCKEVCSGG